MLCSALVVGSRIKSKADIIPSMGGSLRPFVDAARSLPDASLLAERVTPAARRFGGLASYNNSTHREVARRIAAMRAGWAQLGCF